MEKLVPTVRGTLTMARVLVNLATNFPKHLMQSRDPEADHGVGNGSTAFLRETQTSKEAIFWKI